MSYGLNVEMHKQVSWFRPDRDWEIISDANFCPLPTTSQLHRTFLLLKSPRTLLVEFLVERHNTEKVCGAQDIIYVSVEAIFKAVSRVLHSPPLLSGKGKALKRCGRLQ